MLDDAKQRIILGSLATALVTIRSVIPVDKWSVFHQNIASEGRVLVIRLKHIDYDEARFQEIVSAYESAILRAGKEASTLINPFVSPTPDSTPSP